jgi:Aromatic acid exporter family member 1
MTQSTANQFSRSLKQAIAANLPLGKTALKVATAATLAYVMAESLRWEYPFYAVIAAIIVTGSTSGSTWSLSIQRIVGTVLGAIVGALFSTALGSTPWALELSIFSAILLSSAWKLNEAAKLVSYVSAIVILNHSQNPWIYAWGRLLETLLGISAALCVSHVLFPAHAGTELRRSLSQVLLELEQLYQLVMQGAFADTYDRTLPNQQKIRIITLLEKNRGLRKEIKQGLAGEPPETIISETWDFLIHRIWEHILTMEHTMIVRQQKMLWQMLSPELTQLAQDTSAGMIELAIAVKARHSSAGLPSLEAALNLATDRFNQLQITEQGDRLSYPLDHQKNDIVDKSLDNGKKDDLMHEILRFSTFFYTMEEVGRKLQRMADLL